MASATGKSIGHGSCSAGDAAKVIAACLGEFRNDIVGKRLEDIHYLLSERMKGSVNKIPSIAQLKDILDSLSIEHSIPTRKTSKQPERSSTLVSEIAANTKAIEALTATMREWIASWK